MSIAPTRQKSTSFVQFNSPYSGASSGYGNSNGNFYANNTLNNQQRFYSQTSTANTYSDSTQIASDDKSTEQKGFWDWNGTIVSMSAIVGALLSATLLYKPIASTGIGKYIPFKEFYTDKRDGFIKGLKETINLDQFNLSKEKMGEFLNGSIDQMQAIVDHAIEQRNQGKSDGDKIGSLDVKTQIKFFIDLLKTQGKSETADLMQKRMDSGEPPMSILFDKINGYTELVGVDFKRELLEQLPHNQETFGNFIQSLGDQIVGRVLSFIGGYGVFSVAVSKALTLGAKTDDKKKQDDMAMQNDPLMDFVEEMILMGLGAWAGHGLGAKFKLGKNGLRAMMAGGAALGFGAAEFMSNGIRFIYDKIRAMLPKDQKDSLLVKTGFQLAMGSLVAWLFYLKASVGKLSKFTASMKDASLRPTANMIAGGFMTGSNQVVEFASSLAIPNYKANVLNAICGVRLPEGASNEEKILAGATNAGKSPFKTINDTIDKNNKMLEDVKEHNLLIGKIAEVLTKISDTFAGFPLIQKMAREHEDGFVPLNTEYFARGAGDILIKMFNKVIICGIGSLIFFPFVYLYNLIQKQFKKDDKDKSTQQTNSTQAA